MIKEFEFYHGAVFTSLIQNGKNSICIERYPSDSNSSYILNETIGLYIKYSTKRLSPWRFSFLKVHQDEILEMKNKLDNVFMILVCGDDGIVTFNFDELKTILNEAHEEVEWISASRTRNKEYTLKGSDGILERKVSKSDFPKKVFELDVLLKNKF